LTLCHQCRREVSSLKLEMGTSHAALPINRATGEL
jgi:hypothetical protein